MSNRLLAKADRLLIKEASAIAQLQAKRPRAAAKMSPTKKLKVKRSAKSRV